MCSVFRDFQADVFCVPRIPGQKSNVDTSHVFYSNPMCFYVFRTNDDVFCVPKPKTQSVRQPAHGHAAPFFFAAAVVSNLGTFGAETMELIS